MAVNRINSQLPTPKIPSCSEWELGIGRWPLTGSAHCPLHSALEGEAEAKLTHPLFRLLEVAGERQRLHVIRVRLPADEAHRLEHVRHGRLEGLSVDRVEHVEHFGDRRDPG